MPNLLIAGILAISSIGLCCTQTDLSSQLSSAYCNDDFNRADADSLGEIWSFASLGNLNNNRSAKTISGQASMTEPGGGFTYLACKQNVDQKNMTISAKITPKLNFSSAKIISLVARSQSTGSLANAYICGLDYNGSAKLSLYKGVNTLRTDLAISSTTQTVTGGTTYSLAFSISGSQLKCTLSAPAVDEVTAADSSFSAGYVGVFAWTLGNTLDYTFDDFKTEVKP